MPPSVRTRCTLAIPANTPSPVPDLRAESSHGTAVGSADFTRALSSVMNLLPSAASQVGPG